MVIVGLIITIVVNALTLFILSKIPPLGIEITKPIAAFLGGAIIGILNGIWGLLPDGLRLFAGIFSLGLVPLIVALIVFGLSAWLVEGFRLRWGIWSLIVGAIAFALVNSFIFWLLGNLNLIPVAA